VCLFVQGETRCSLTDKWTESSCPPTDLVYADTHGCDCRSRRTCSAESSETQTSHQGPSSVACFSLAKSIKAIEWIDDAGINHIVYGTLCSDSSETVSCNASQLLLTSQPRFQSIPRHLHGSESCAFYKQRVPQQCSSSVERCFSSAAAAGLWQS